MLKSLKRSDRYKIAALTLAMVICLSLPVFAKEKKDEATVTREVLVTASRTEQELKETPTTAQVITSEDIATMGAQTVRDALKIAMNVDVKKGGMVGNSVSIRGMNTTHTLILIDGRRMAGEDTSETANVYTLDRINLDTVERIEIVRGAGSALYGSEALGGVINIITKLPDKQSVTVGFSGGSDLLASNLRINTGKIGKWAFMLDTRFQRMRETSFATGTSSQNGPTEFYNFKGTYNFTDNQRLDIFYEKMNEHLKNWTTATSQKYYENRRDAFGMTYRENGKKSNYEIKMYYDKLDKDQKDAARGTGAITGFDRAEYETWVIEGKNTIQMTDEHRLTFGAEYRSNKYRGTRLGSAGDNAGTISKYGLSKDISEREIKYKAIYIQDEWMINDKLLLIPSLRFDDSDKFASNWSPKIGLTYKLDDNYRVKTSYGKGFRAPTISELYMEFRGTMGPYTTAILGNPDLEPEKSENWEISFEGEKNNNFGKITYFYNDVKNLINSDAVMQGFPFWTINSKYVNVDKARLSGMELELGRHLNKNFTVKLGYNYLDAIDKSDNSRLTSRARHTATLQLRYDDGKKDGISAILWNEWKNDYYYSSKNYDYSILNFSINKKWNNNKYNAYFAIENMFDKKITDITLYEGRIWRVGFNVTI